MAKRYENLDRSLQNSVRVTGLIFLPALLVINVFLLLDEERRMSPTSGRGFYALGLPGWMVDGAVTVGLTVMIVFIIVGWVRQRRRTRLAQESAPARPDGAGD
ncbi:hypothetical protein ACTU3I_14565 [Microbacterium sp. RD1]|uniref:hypothetical protein n=1 Tax=Microbacterium sp. RD1 TaxID=3457313 RepID=UPI003FA5CFD9